MSEWLAQHWQVLKGIADRRWFRLAIVALSVVGSYDTLGAQVLPKSIADKLPPLRDLVAMTSGWLPWWAWGWIGTAVFAGAAIEYAVRLYGVTRPAAAPEYWTLCEAATWVAYGKPMRFQDYSLQGTDILPPEEAPAIQAAERALLTALQNSDRLTAFGREDGKGGHKQIPFTYFLSDSAGTNFLNDSFQLRLGSSIEDILNDNIVRWSEVRLPRRAVLKLWPRGRLYTRPKGGNASKARQAINQFMTEADTLIARPLGSEPELITLSVDYENWRESVTGWFRDHSSKARADYFSGGRYLTINKHPNALNRNHSFLLSKITHDRRALETLMVLETYSG